MFQQGGRRTTYGVYVRFRKSRLPMRRGIVRLEEALAMAETLRRERMHGPDDVFVVREPDGVRVDGASPSSPPAADAVIAGDDASAAAAVSQRNCAPAASAPIPAATHPSAHRPVETGTTSPDALWHLISGVERARRASARAVEIHARFERTTAALEAALQRGAGVPPRLLQQRARIQALRALVASASASFDRVTALAEARLHGAWMESAGAAHSRARPAGGRV